jgi:hypothetical protein
MPGKVRKKRVRVQAEVMLVHNFPVTLRNQFRALCTLQRTSMSQQVRAILKKLLAEPYDPEPPGPIASVGPVRPLTLHVDSKLRRRFLAWCELRGLTMRHRIIVAVEALLRQSLSGP